ncbi:MAG TPA: N-formylglutamate amidohydrolase [Gillisia sp.]|nr:N-formylglutamate amidohydrolase [Gillisia sp.]
MKLVFSCEHGGNEIPEYYKHLFKNADEALNSHRGIDFGTLDLFNYCSSLSAYSISNKISRLLIELNRSLHHPKLFSEYTAALNDAEKSKLIDLIYNPYRDKLEAEISKIIAEGEEVAHISFHSFTPVLDGKIRNADIGLLFDPSRASEKMICKKLKELLKTEIPAFIIRFNYPYLGKADGLTTYLRKKFPENYSGIEIEINQKLSNKNVFETDLKNAIYNSIKELKKPN